MSGVFSFPPPPPPPLPAAKGNGSVSHEASQSRGRGRGRGNGGFGRGGFDQRGRGSLGGRGRGNSFPANNSSRDHWQSRNGPQSSRPNASIAPISHPSPVLPPGSYINPAFTKPPPSTSDSIDQHQHQQTSQLHPRPTADDSPQHTVAGHKRKLEAFRESPREKKPAPQTAPATPSFGALPSLSPKDRSLPTKPALRQSQEKSKPGSKSLGLTPGVGEVEYSSSDDGDGGEDDEDNDAKDVDEEALYAELGDKLTFEHNGTVVSLTSQADLIAWKKDRQKNWPTQARTVEKDEERRRVGAERRRLLASAAVLRKRPQHKSSNTWAPKKEDSKNDSTLTEDNPATSNEQQQPQTDLAKAQAALAAQATQLEQLRRRVAESEARNRNSRTQLEQAQTSGSLAADVDESDPDVSILLSAGKDDLEEDVADNLTVDATKPMDEGSPLSTSEKSSSEVSSDSDSDDSSPEEISTKPPVEPASGGSKVCRYFAASGHCRDGDVCRFRHEMSNKAPTLQQSFSRENRDARPKPSHGQHGSEQEIEKKTILGRLMEQEQDEEARLALQAIIYLGNAGFFHASSPSSEL